MTSTDRLVIGACAIVATIVAIAIWKRPPARDASGRRIVPTALINWFALLGAAAIPFGLAGVSIIARGQNIGPAMVGMGLAVEGLVAFVLYALFWRLTKRPTISAGLAVTIPGVPLILVWLPQILRHVAGENPA
jgi:hypothetical protein